MRKSQLLTILILISVMFLFAAVSGARAEKCGDKEKPCVSEKMEKHDHGKDGKDVKKSKAIEQTLTAKEAKKGDLVICPVLKSEITVGDKSLYVEYKGKKYYVCCEACIDDLKKNPEKYLKKK